MAKIILKKPVVLDQTTTISELNFRDHTTAADYLSFDKVGGVAQNIALIASMSSNDEALIKRLSGKDYHAAVKIVDAVLKEDSSEDAEKK